MNMTINSILKKQMVIKQFIVAEAMAEDAKAANLDLCIQIKIKFTKIRFM